MTLLAGLLLAGLSALVSQIGFLLRHRGAVDAPDVDVRHPLASTVGLFRSKWWSVGYALAVVAYGLHVGAPGLAALSLVQAVLAERFFGFELTRRQWVGVALSALGLALLALTREARSGDHSADYSVAAMIACQGGLVAIGTALILSYRLPRLRGHLGILLALAAGLLFTMTHVAVKAVTGTDDSGPDALLHPYLLLAAAGGIAAFFASARSLQIGPAVPVIAVTSIAGNASAIPAGIVVFGDPLGDDALIVTVRILAFLLVVVAAALIPAPTRAARSARERGRAGRRPALA